MKLKCCQSRIILTLILATEAVAYFLTDDEEDACSPVFPIFCQYHSTSMITGHKSPRVHALIEGHKIPLLLDTGAECTVLPKTFMSNVVSAGTAETRVVQSFGGAEVTLEGPRLLQVEICGVKLVHPFYALDSYTQLVAGYDLIVAARHKLPGQWHDFCRFWPRTCIKM